MKGYSLEQNKEVNEILWIMMNVITRKISVVRANSYCSLFWKTIILSDNFKREVKYRKQTNNLMFFKSEDWENWGVFSRCEWLREEDSLFTSFNRYFLVMHYAQIITLCGGNTKLKDSRQVTVLVEFKFDGWMSIN